MRQRPLGPVAPDWIGLVIDAGFALLWIVVPDPGSLVIGDTVVDPFLGSGTTTKVAMDIHRNSLGYEIDSQLIPTLRNRFEIEEDHYRFVDNSSVKTLTITRRKDSV